MKNKWKGLLTDGATVQPAASDVTWDDFPDRSLLLPFVIRSSGSVMLEQWIKMNLEDIEEKLSSCGAILFRGFDVQSASDFRVAMSAFGKEIMDYTERTSPGTHVAELSAENIALINKGIDNHLKND